MDLLKADLKLAKTRATVAGVNVRVLPIVGLHNQNG